MNSESSMKPIICPKLGSTGRRAGLAPVGAGSLTPMMNSRLAPRWIAGLNGEVWRMAPSPKYCSSSSTGRNKKGIEVLARGADADTLQMLFVQASRDAVEMQLRAQQTPQRRVVEERMRRMHQP